jgi:hypothetical protein
MDREPPPAPPPPNSFPIPFARQRSTDHTQNAGTSAYPPAGPPPGNNRPARSGVLTPYVVHSTEPRRCLVPSPSTHTSQLYTSLQPSQPLPVRISTRPHLNVTALASAPIPAFTTPHAPPYKYTRPPPVPQMSGSTSQYSSISDPGLSIPAVACLFCRERKITCGAPPVVSADTTCKYVCPFDTNRGN